MKEFIAERMPYDALQEKVLENESAIQELKDNPSGGGGVSVSNTTSKDAIAMVKANSSEMGLLENTGSFEQVPVIKRGSSEIIWKTVSTGAGNAHGIPMRNGSNGHIRVPTIENKAGIAAALKDNTETVDVALSVNSLLNLTQNSSAYVPKSSSQTFNIEPRGLYIVRGGTTTIDGMSGASECHIMIFFNDSSNGAMVLHLYVATLGLKSEAISYTPTTMKVNCTDTTYGTYVIHTDLTTV